MLTRAYLNSLSTEHKKIIAFVVVCLLVGASVVGSCAGCNGSSFLGISDPIVRSATFDAASALQMVYDHSDQPDIVKEYAELAIVSVRSLQKMNLSDLDKKKVQDALEGIAKIIQKADNESYVTLRSKSMRALVNSIGLYGNEGLKNIAELLDNRAAEQPQTQPK
mgnify:CR=1 FL=1